MKYDIRMTTKFKKSLGRIKKRGYDLSLMDFVVDSLADGKVLESKYKDHALVGNHKGYRECHINPDWLLIYKYSKNELILFLIDTGAHRDVFPKKY